MDSSSSPQLAKRSTAKHTVKKNWSDFFIKNTFLQKVDVYQSKRTQGPEHLLSPNLVTTKVSAAGKN